MFQNSEYIVTAKAKGLTKATVIIKHALRNALVPVITMLGPLAASLLTGSLVVERVFAVPGMGDLLVNAINTNDLFVISGVAIVYSAFYISVILLVDILYGVELNILDYKGTVDLEDEILETLDYAIISMHTQNVKPASVEENTFAYVNAMSHPKVKIIGHCDDVKFPVDYEALMVAAKHYGVVFEINNASLSPDGYRGDTRENVKTILELCKKYNHPIVLSSDSHGKKHVGDFKYALKMIKETDFPEDLILNYSTQSFKEFIQ